MVSTANPNVPWSQSSGRQLFRLERHIASAARVDGVMQRRSSGAEGVGRSTHREIKRRDAPARAAGGRTSRNQKSL
jgi:hypothetical protein